MARKEKHAPKQVPAAAQAVAQPAAAPFPATTGIPGLRSGGLVYARRELNALIQEVAAAAGLAGAVALSLAADGPMALLNVQYAHTPGPTNVLAFPAVDDARQGPDGADSWLGDVVLNPDALEREVFLYGQDPQRHLLRLLAHACLHIAGHDHGPIMDALTDAIVEQLGH